MPEYLEEANIRQIGGPEFISVNDDQLRRISVAIPHIAELSEDAAKATKAERQMSLFQGLKTYPKAVGWSMLLSTAIIMEGFDMILLDNLFAYEPFQRKFGVQQPNGTYQLTAAWQSGLSNGALVGEIFGLFIVGLVSERIGYRKTMIGALVSITAFIFVVFFSQSIVQLLIGAILVGIPWGIFQTITTTYAAEVCPVALRAYLTTYVNLCWVMGQLLGSGVLRAMVNRNDDWGFRIPFALQWIWPLPLIIGISFAPESPWWLIRRGDCDGAKRALLRLTTQGKDPSFNANETIAMMKHTNALEEALSEGTRYIDCFKGTDLRRTEIVSFTWAIQTLCGKILPFR
jgi:SP family general alpha glucoside:H+ symporter-like MFS transporter